VDNMNSVIGANLQISLEPHSDFPLGFLSDFRPSRAGMDDFREELKFFELKGRHVDEFMDEETELMTQQIDDAKLPKNLLKRKLWLLMEDRMSSDHAKLLSYLSILAIVLSTMSYCLNTVEEFRGGYHRDYSIVDLRDPFFLTESVCVVFFTFELIIRFVTSGNKIDFFLKSFSNIADLISIVPLIVEIFVFLADREVGGPYELQCKFTQVDNPEF